MTVNKTRLGSGDFARRIRFEQSGNLSATDVQEAIEELDAEKQGLDATLTSIAALGTVADRLAYTTGVDTWAEAAITAAGRALIDDASAAAQRTTLGVAIGTDVQAFDATLASLAGLGTVADRLAYTTGVDTWAETPLTAAGRALIDDATAADQRATLGLGALATLGSVNNTNWSGDDLAILNGGTGASDAATAFGNIKQDATETATGVLEIGTAAEFRNNTANKAVVTDRVWSAAGLVTLTDAGTIAVDMSAGFNFEVTLAGNRTLGNPTNVKAGQSGLIIVNQDATGSRLLTYGANWEFPSGVAPTLTATASAKDILTYFAQTGGSIIVTGVLRDVS